MSVGKETIVFPGFDGARSGRRSLRSRERTALCQFYRMAWTGGLAKPDRNVRPAVYLTQCAAAIATIALGAAACKIPSVADLAGRRKARVSAVIRQGAGRMPAFPKLCARRWGRGGAVCDERGSKEMESKEACRSMEFRFTGYHKFVDTEGYRRSLRRGELNAINLNTGEYAWKISSGSIPSWGRRA